MVRLVRLRYGRERAGSARIALEATCEEVPALLAGTDSYRLDLAGWALREEVRGDVMGRRTMRLKGP